MKVSVMGTGIVGRTIATKLNELGHEVVIGTREVAKTLSSTDGDVYGNPSFSVWHKDHSSIKLLNFADAARHSEQFIFNCTSGQASIPALELTGKDNLAGKILIDIANPLDFSQGMPPSLNPVNTDSLGEQIQRTFPDLRVVKTLNTMNTFLMVNPGLLEGDHSVFLSGNDADAKAAAAGVLQSFGWPARNIIDLGDISTARGTEMLLPIWLRLWQALATAEFNFYIQKNG